MDVYFPKCLAIFFAMSDLCGLKNSDIKGDFDGDFDIDSTDFIHFLGAYGDYWFKGILNERGDFDSDNDIDFHDIFAFISDFKGNRISRARVESVR